MRDQSAPRRGRPRGQNGSRTCSETIEVKFLEPRKTGVPQNQATKRESLQMGGLGTDFNCEALW